MSKQTSRMYLRKLPIILSLCFAILALLACGPNSKESSLNLADGESVTKSKNVKTKAENTMKLTGQILYQQFEGGFYGFVAQNGDKYLPSGLAEKYRQNGLIVEIEAQLIPGLLSTQQFGDVIKVLKVKVIDDTKITKINKHETM